MMMMKRKGKQISSNTVYLYYVSSINNHSVIITYRWAGGNIPHSPEYNRKHNSAIKVNKLPLKKLQEFHFCQSVRRPQWPLTSYDLNNLMISHNLVCFVARIWERSCRKGFIFTTIQAILCIISGDWYTTWIDVNDEQITAVKYEKMELSKNWERVYQFIIWTFLICTLSTQRLSHTLNDSERQQMSTETQGRLWADTKQHRPTVFKRLVQAAEKREFGGGETEKQRRPNNNNSPRQ